MPGHACPICIAYPQKSAADHLLASSCVVFARENPEKPFSYAPVEVLKGSAEGKQIELFLDSRTRRMLATFPDRVVVLAEDGSDGSWRNLGLANEAYVEVVRGIVSLAPLWQGPGGDERRVEFFVPLFGHENPLIYKLAYLELAQAPYGTIKRVSRSVPREQIERVLHDRMYVDWRPLAILMLAQTGEEEDQRYISESFRSAARFGVTKNLAAWAAAAIEVEGADAVSFIQHSYFTQPDHSRDELLEIVKALSVHGTEGRTELRDQIVASYATLLDVHPEMGAYVAKDLIAWKRTDLSERLLAAAATRAGLELPPGMSPDPAAAEPREIRWSDLEALAAVSLDEQCVKLPGYVLPLKSADEVVTEFLLVPYVGACIHTPPPPPKQIVYVSAPQGLRDPGLFAPVWVTGRLDLKETRNSLFLVDGSAEITAGYALDTTRIDEYSAAHSNALAEVEVPASRPDHSLWQSLQVQTSLLFSRTMTDIRDRRSILPLLLGVLVAFAYGVIHTLGPGHGKAVVVSYFVGEGGSLLRGIRFGTQIAVAHVLAAVAVAVLADLAIRRATGTSPGSFRGVRLASYAVIAVIGAAMLAGATRSVGRRGDDHHREHHCGCPHSGKRESAAGFGFLSLAIGAVPCTGALMVLLYGVANGLLWPSVLMVIAISAGMAVAMSAIGVAAILGRRFVESRLKQDASRQGRLLAVLRIAGATCVLLIGLALFSLTLLSGSPASLPLVAR